MNAFLRCSMLLAGLTACAGDVPDEAVQDPTGRRSSPPTHPTAAALSYVLEGDTVVLRLDMDRIRRSGLADELGAWLKGHETWGATLSRAGIDPVQDFDRLLAVAPTSDPAESIVFARHGLAHDRIRQAIGRVAGTGNEIAWRQVQGFEATRIALGAEDARVVVLAAPNELVVATPALFDRVLRVARDHRDRRVADELVEPALALDDGTIATVFARRLNGWALERMPDPPPEALDLRMTDDAQAQGRVHVHANGTYSDPSAATAAGRGLTERRDFYAGHMLAMAAGLNGPLSETRIQANGSELDVRAWFTEGDIEKVIGMVAMMQQFGSLSGVVDRAIGGR